MSTRTQHTRTGGGAARKTRQQGCPLVSHASLFELQTAAEQERLKWATQVCRSPAKAQSDRSIRIGDAAIASGERNTRLGTYDEVRQVDLDLRAAFRRQPDGNFSVVKRTAC
jgi:hypothetical protein